MAGIGIGIPPEESFHYFQKTSTHNLHLQQVCSACCPPTHPQISALNTSLKFLETICNSQ